MRVLITRAQPDADETADHLEKRGIRSLVIPLTTVTFRSKPEIFLPAPQALLITSKNGVRATHAHYPDLLQSLPVICVGDETAALAQQHGATTLFSAQGTVTELTQLVHASLRPENGPVWHMAGADIRTDLIAILQGLGFTGHRHVLYDMTPVDTHLLLLTEVLEQHHIDGVMLFSPQQARRFAHVVHQLDRADACRRLSFWCISEATAQALSPVHGQTVIWPSHPAQAALLDLVHRP